MKNFIQFVSEDFENYLTENRIDWAEKNLSPKIDQFLQQHKHLFYNETSKDIIHWIANEFDPTRNKSYIQWLVNQLLKHPDTFEEDKERIRGDLETFERVKTRMPGDQRDINKFKDYHDVSTAIAPFEDSKSKNEMKADEVDKFKADIKYLYRGPEGVIAVPTTRESSCFLGRGTKWCTAATNSENYFHSYSKAGPLYVLMHKDGTKWQFHLQTSQYMNENDTPLTPDQIQKSKLFPILERLVWNDIKRNPLSWAKGTGSSNPEFVKEIAKNAEHSIEYARAIKKRFKEGEPAILTNKSLAIQYVRDVLKGPWPELEEKLAKMPSFMKRAYDLATQGK